ncbi:arsenate reductase (glutaredoxin) [Halomonas borealis]|uniref:arsenate reductase (glutaredoxin) n=1 Tax=Halomonas borealis TaxID=2508710 RepID=UPI0010A0972B|nr:arsenate reductase (glutaredoxin) [Halomonas borealis]
MITLLHNPRCSKSRQALALLEERGVDVLVRRYLEDPLDGAELRALIARLTSEPRDLVRVSEPEWKALGADRDQPQQVVDAIVAHPKILQRPIADDGTRAIIGRPPEDLLALLD